jgi:glutamine amidotransferase
MVGIIDYGAGNIRSVEHALNHLGIPSLRSAVPRELAGCTRLIFPGVGDARYAMGNLAATGLGSFLKDAALQGTPILGICLGSQIIFDHSEEGDVDCLGLLRGTVRHFSRLWEERPDATEAAKEGRLKVPHMGWNDVVTLGEGDGGIPAAPYYFVHSYVICPGDAGVVAATADYGIPVPAVIRAGNVMACQFHPEKSGEPGLKLLRHFCEAPLC